RALDTSTADFSTGILQQSDLLHRRSKEIIVVVQEPEILSARNADTMVTRRIRMGTLDRKPLHAAVRLELLCNRLPRTVQAVWDNDNLHIPVRRGPKCTLNRPGQVTVTLMGRNNAGKQWRAGSHAKVPATFDDMNVMFALRR